MVKKRSGEPWRPAPEYAATLSGLSINLLVPDIAAALPFHNHVLGAETVYSDPDFAVFRFAGAEWCLHADHTYQDHPLHGSLGPELGRGIGAELRLHGRDPDVAEAAARERDFVVLAGALDKPHGLREAYILDHSGYLWVPDVPLSASPGTDS